MKSHGRLSFLGILALLVTGYVIVAPAIKAADPASATHSEEVSQLLSEAKAEAFELRHDAMHMETFTRHRRLSWKSHAAQLTLIKEHVNQTGKLLTKLQNLREAAAPWQQQAIDQIEPLLKQLAANTTAAIEHINATKSEIRPTSYNDYLVANYATSNKLEALIRDFVDYEEAAEKLESLSQKLVIAER